MLHQRLLRGKSRATGLAPMLRGQKLNSLRTLVVLLVVVLALGPRAALGDDVLPPRIVSQPKPRWPEVRAEVHDVIVPVVLEVAADGSVVSVQIEASVGPEYDAEATRTARTWTFTPALRNGTPVAARIRSVVRFHAPLLPSPRKEDQVAEQHELATAERGGGRPDARAEQEGRQREDESEVATAKDVQVIGRSGPVSRGASDYRIHVGALARVPRASAAELLELSPGVFLSNEGGSGHAERIYLRGFDAREGQDIELSVDGVPVNDSGSPHGNGAGDLQLVIPETVHALRVLEGPFDPRQGNYAVAGSAEYELGLDRRGLTAKYTTGSFGAERLLFLWGPEGERLHTFGAAEYSSSDGYGQNRDVRRATAAGQYEGAAGKSGTFRLASTVYTTEYHSAGLLRQGDVDAGRVGYFDTYDTGQGGQSTRFHVSGDIETRTGGVLLYNQVFGIRRTLRLRQNYTGFLLDTQEATQSPHGQRGDLFDSSMEATTFGGRGFARSEARALGHPQTLELGYFARGDGVASRRQRLLDGTNVPYRTDTDVDSTLFDVGLYADAGLRFLPWLGVRGGVRTELLSYDVLDRCAVQAVSRPAPRAADVDASCFDQQRFGEHREPDQRSTTATGAVLPRATLLLGPFSSFLLTFSYGQGIRSIDPVYVTQDVATPFARIESLEGGVTFARTFAGMSLEGKSVFFGTHVDKDHVFSETEGRSVLGGGTTRAGWSGSVRATTTRWDESLNVTLVRSTFDDTGLLVPYAPDLVVRSDSAYTLPLPIIVRGRSIDAGFGLGMGYVGRRALPFGQRSDTTFLVDGSASLEYGALVLELSGTNLLDTRYRSAESFYASDFRSQEAPTLVPVRHFAAGSPRAVFLSLAVTLGGEP